MSITTCRKCGWDMKRSKVKYSSTGYKVKCGKCKAEHWLFISWMKTNA